MKRGLKGLPNESLIDFTLVEEYSPMKRGLKVGIDEADGIEFLWLKSIPQ